MTDSAGPQPGSTAGAAPSQPPPLPPPPSGTATGVAYAIFEGGGARGITHIGAVKALERERIEIIGVAGASAGAIVAALVAAGCSADQLYDPQAGTDILTRRRTGDGKPLTPTALLGGTAWASFVKLQGRLGQLARHGRWLLVLLVVAVVLAVIAGRPGALLLVLVLVGLLIWLGPLVWQLRPLAGRLGLFDSRGMADQLNAILREQLAAHYRDNMEFDRKVPDIVTFADLDPVLGGVKQCRPLKIVVSDVTKGTVCIFDRNTPGAAVADAVAASAAIPLFFAPPAVRGGPQAVFADGGLVSNLPVWVFAGDKRRQERDLATTIPIFAFKLDDAPPAADSGAGGGPAGLAALGHHITRVARTGIFGSQAVIAEVLPDVVPIALPTRLGTLQFDVGRDAANGAYHDGLRAAAIALARRRLERQLLDALLAGILAEVQARVAALMPGAPVRVRASLLDPDRRYTRDVESFRIVASAGMAGDPDAALSIDSRSRGAPSAWVARRPVYVDDLLDGNAGSRHMTPQEDALVWRGLKSLIAVPIFARPEFADVPAQLPHRILCLDADAPLKPLFEQAEFGAWLISETVILSYASIEEIISERIPEGL